MAVLTLKWTAILSSYGINTSVVVSKDSLHIRWLTWSHIYGTHTSMVMSKSSMTSVKWRAWMYTVLLTQNKTPFRTHDTICRKLHFYPHRFSETGHWLQIILALVIPNHNTSAFCDKGEVVLTSYVMATSDITRVRISCGSHQSSSWPKISVFEADTQQVLCNIYNLPCG
jgi:hypothetical protein